MVRQFIIRKQCGPTVPWDHHIISASEAAGRLGEVGSLTTAFFTIMIRSKTGHGVRDPPEVTGVRELKFFPGEAEVLLDLTGPPISIVDTLTLELP